MIANSRQFVTTVRHLTRLTDMLTAMYLDAKERNDFALFPLTSEGYVAKIREINAELRAYLDAHPNEGRTSPEPVTTAPGRRT